MYNILLVDDDMVVRYLLKKMNLWEKYGFAISDEAADGYEALKKVSSSQFDIAFVDIKMPRIDGIEFLKELRENGNDMCIIFLSGFSDFAFVRQGIILGAFDYMLKPVEESNLCDLLSRLKIYLDNKKKKNMLRKLMSGFIDNSLNISGFSKEITPINKKLHLYNEHPIVRRLCEYVLLHSYEKTSLDSASKELGFSSSYLGRLFKQKTGECFTEYVTKVKMEVAKKLLHSGKYKNYEISNMLSYSDVNYFCSLFKKYIGMTPTYFRQSIYSQRNSE